MVKRTRNIAALLAAFWAVFLWSEVAAAETASFNYAPPSLGSSQKLQHDDLALELTGIDGDKQDLDAELTCLAALTSAADKIAYFTGSGTCAVTDFSSFIRTLIDDANASAARTTLGVVIGTDVQAFDADLAALAALSTDGLWAHTGAGTGSARTLTAPAAGLSISNPAGIAGNPTFALANDLSALEGLGSTGFAVRTTTDTWAQRTLTAPAAGFTITNPAGVAGDPTFVLANDLAAFEGLASNGIVARTATDTAAVRTITGTAAEITATNGDGVSGNPTLSLPAALTFTGKTITGGTFSTPTVTTAVLNGTVTGTSLAQAATASTLVQRDANANSTSNSFITGYTTTATAAGTTTLTVASTQLQFFTGVTTQTVVLPVTSTLALGQTFTVVNNSSGAVQVQSSGANNILSVAAGNTGIFTVILTSGTSAASWSNTYISSGAGTGTVTSVTCGTGMTGGTFTTTGTCDNVAATTTASGISELATSAETITGTDTVRATTPAGVAAAIAAVSAYPPGTLYGCGISNAADTNNDITIAACKTRDETDTGNMVLAAPITKQMDAAWAVGTNAGCLNTGAEASSTWYEVIEIKRVDTGVVDVMCSTTANRATLPTNYTLGRRIAWIRNDGSSALLQFTQVEDFFTLTTQVNDVSASATATAAAVTLTAPPNSVALFRGSMVTSATNNDRTVLVFSEIAEGNVTPAVGTGIASLTAVAGGGNAAQTSAQFELRVDGSSQIEHDSVLTAGTATFDISTFGWIDTRLRLGP